MKNAGLIFLVGCGMLLIAVALGKVANVMAPSLQGEYANTAIFREATDPKMALFWLVPFITAGLVFWIWRLARGHIQGGTYMIKGINFGLVYWTLTVPGMIMSFCTFQLSAAIVLSWAISNLGQYLFAGLMYARWRA